MQWSLHQLQRTLHYYSYAQAAGAYACQQQPNDPHDEANDRDEEGEKSEGETQEKAQGSAITIWVAHILCVFLSFFSEKEEVGVNPCCVSVLLRREEDTRLVA